MGHPEDKIIRKKITELNTLPDGYDPNMDSKWSLIEAGLGEKKKKPLILLWKIAAMLLLVGGAAAFWLQPRHVAKSQAKLQNPHAPLVIGARPRTNSPLNRTKVSAHRHSLTKSKSLQHARKTQPSTISLTAVTYEENKPEEIQIPETNVLVAVTPKQARYTELDFSNDSSAGMKSSEQIVATPSFKFKFGLQTVSAQRSAPASEVRLKKSIHIH